MKTSILAVKPRLAAAPPAINDADFLKFAESPEFRLGWTIETLADENRQLRFWQRESGSNGSDQARLAPGIHAGWDERVHWLFGRGRRGDAHHALMV